MVEVRKKLRLQQPRQAILVVFPLAGLIKNAQDHRGTNGAKTSAGQISARSVDLASRPETKAICIWVETRRLASFFCELSHRIGRLARQQVHEIRLAAHVLDGQQE